MALHLKTFGVSSRSLLHQHPTSMLIRQASIVHRDPINNFLHADSTNLSKTIASRDERRRYTPKPGRVESAPHNDSIHPIAKLPPELVEHILSFMAPYVADIRPWYREE